jgi:hyperosmotically inducible protein
MNTRYVLTAVTALVIGGMPLLGCQSMENAPVSDLNLTSKARIALFADSRVKGQEIDVETTEGQVMLRGTVDSTVARQAAEDIAKKLDGVKSVKNDLEVLASSMSEAVVEKDEDITTHVKANLAKDAQLMSVDITVQTIAGVVSLKGEVPDLMTSANASWTAWHVPGVQAVKNDLTLKEKA